MPRAIDGLLDLFVTVFALSIDENTLKHRLETRTNNDWGKQPHELQWSLEQLSYRQGFYKKAGFMTIDAMQPVKTVVDAILNEV